MRAFCRCRQKGVKKAEIKAEINRSALAGEPDPLERWLMALWVPLGLRKLGKDKFEISYFFPCKEFFHSMRAIILIIYDVCLLELSTPCALSRQREAKCLNLTAFLSICFVSSYTHTCSKLNSATKFCTEIII